MGSQGPEKEWVKMAEKTVYSTPEEWAYAKELMNKRIQNGEKPPFKIYHDKENLSHSFLVALNSDNKPILGVIAKSKDSDEGVLGFGSFGVCKLVLWEDGKKNAIKIVPDNLEQYEIEVMQKLGLIRSLFKREWDKRILEKSSQAKTPSTQWIAGKTITDKLYMVMPLIEGIDLNQYLSSNDNALSMPTQRIVATSIVRQLQAMHAAKVLHNDLHTKNVMVDASLNAYLIDQGKSIDLDNVPTVFDKVHLLFGRDDIMAPELKNFKEELKRTYREDSAKAAAKEYQIPASTASDVYSLGLLFQDIFYPVAKSEPVKSLIAGMTNYYPESRLELSEVLKTLESPQLIKMVEDHRDWLTQAQEIDSEDEGLDLSIENQLLIENYDEDAFNAPKKSPRQ